MKVLENNYQQLHWARVTSLLTAGLHWRQLHVHQKGEVRDWNKDLRFYLKLESSVREFCYHDMQSKN